MSQYELPEVLGTANEFIRQGRFEDALVSLSTLSGPRDPVLEVTCCRLIALTGLSRWQELIDEASAALRALSRNSASLSALASVHSLLGNAYLRTGDVARCESHLRAAIHIFTWDLGAPLEALAPTRILAALYSNLGMWTTARHELNRAIKVADENNAGRESLGLRVNLAVILLKSSSRGDALRVIEDASRLADSETFTKQRALCALLRARVLRMLSEYLPASRALTETLSHIRAAIMPREEAICLEYLGDCYLGQRDYKKALEHYQQAMKIAEETAPRGDLVPELCHRLAEALVHLGDANQAILLCERGLRVARETSDRYEECATHRVLAMAHRAAGNPIKAHRIAMEGISLGRSYEIPYELARALAWDGETRLQSRGRDDQMIGRLQLWEARAVFERIGLQNEVRTLDRLLGFEEVVEQPSVQSGVAALAEIANLDRGALRFGIITSSPEVSEAVATIQSIAPSKIPVLICGPSGVGKELLAHALHRMSDRRKMPFLPVNCGSISASLIESELFGHERGAFTGAVALREGLFTAADKGTIFLDEIGELPLSTQATLLRVLETGELRRVGSDEVRSIDVRIVAATNADLEEMVERGLFRRDLFFRLEGVIVKVPPLREREEDIRALFRFFFAEAVAVSRKKLTVSDDVESLLCAYAWPGNVRELKNEVARAVVMAESGAVLGRDAFLPKLRKKSPTALREARGRDDATAEERSRILEALRAHAGNKADAARSLGGMKRTTLLYKIDRLHIRPEEYQTEER
jgi:DNA-binding NtrC family response regulator/tetratricopeptide (TPR) repeat protein